MYKDPVKQAEWRRAKALRGYYRSKEKWFARTYARYHFPTAQPCSVMGCKELGQRHHPDYSQPLKIEWICQKHHNDLHRPKERKCEFGFCDRKHQAKGLCGKHYMQQKRK